MFFASSSLKRTSVKVLLQQCDLPLKGNSRSRAHPILTVLTESAESIHAILFLHFGEKIVKRCRGHADVISHYCSGERLCSEERLSSGPHLIKRGVVLQSYTVGWVFLSFLFFLIRGGTHSLRMPALRPSSQAGPMRNPREGTVARHRQAIT